MGYGNTLFHLHWLLNMVIQRKVFLQVRAPFSSISPFNKKAQTDPSKTLMHIFQLLSMHVHGKHKTPFFCHACWRWRDEVLHNDLSCSFVKKTCQTWRWEWELGNRMEEQKGQGNRQIKWNVKGMNEKLNWMRWDITFAYSKCTYDCVSSHHISHGCILHTYITYTCIQTYKIYRGVVWWWWYLFLFIHTIVDLNCSFVKTSSYQGLS